MLDRLARTYLFTLAIFLSLLIAGIVVFPMAMLTGSRFEPNGRAYAVFFAINLPIVGLAKERNIWANEVQQCPDWLRITVKCLFVDSMLVTGLCVFGNMHIPSNFFLAASAFMLMFTFGSACVLWASIKSAQIDAEDLRNRTKRSALTVALFSALYFLFGLLPNKHPNY